MFIPNIDFKELAPNLAKSKKSLRNIAPTRAIPGPVKTLPIPLINPCANFAPILSPCNMSVIPLTIKENAFNISFAASVNPISPKTEANFCPPTVKLLIKASSVSFSFAFFESNAPAAVAETCRALANWLCPEFKSSTKLIKISLCLTPATFWIMSPALTLFKPS